MLIIDIINFFIRIKINWNTLKCDNMPNHYTMHLIVSVIVNKSKNGGKKISGRYVIRTWATGSSVKKVKN